MNQTPNRFPPISLGDINGFLGLTVDNIAVLSFMAGTLILVFDFPAEIIYTRMFPGTTLAILLGDLAYSWLAVRVSKSTGRQDVTAMPLGLDTPSTIGIVLLVLGPAFQDFKKTGLNPNDAALMAWYTGMATMVFIGAVKTVFSFTGDLILRIIPRAGLLGSIAGVGIALIGFIPLCDVFGLPVVGIISFVLIFSTTLAGIELPWRLPGILTAVILGTGIYHLFGYFGLYNTSIPDISLRTSFVALPTPSLDFLQGVSPALKFLPITIPFALLTIVGGINVTESAKAAGDDYKARDILLVEALSTLIAGVCGGVAQSCPYIGHPAYKRMGARIWYTVLTGLFLGFGGVFGYLSFMVELIPRGVLAPILVYIAVEITSQAFLYSPAKHVPAVAIAIFPTIARLVSIQFENPELVAPQVIQHLIAKSSTGIPEVLVVIALGNGFILTGMLWGAAIAHMINKDLKRCAIYFLSLAVFSFFGIIHSAYQNSRVYIPWNLEHPFSRIPLEFALAYSLAGIVMLILSITNSTARHETNS